MNNKVGNIVKKARKGNCKADTIETLENGVSKQIFRRVHVLRRPTKENGNRAQKGRQSFVCVRYTLIIRE